MHFYSVRHVLISNYELIVENLHVFFILISYNGILSCLRQAARKSIVEGLRERTEYIDKILFSAHHSMAFYILCFIYW